MKFNKESLLNKIKRNGILIIARERLNREITWYLDNGDILKGQEFFSNDPIFSIECKGIPNHWVENRVFQRIWLTKPYYSNKYHAEVREPIKHSEETKRKISTKAKERDYTGERNPMYGKSVVDIWKENYGEDWEIHYNSWIKSIKEATAGDKNPFYGKKHSKETLDIIKEKGKKTRDSWSEDKKKEVSENISNAQKNYREKIGEEFYRKEKSKAGKMSVLSLSRFKMNKLEKKVLDILKNEGYDIQYSIVLNGKYQYDFRIKNTRILIEVQGDFWHANPNIERFKNVENLYEFQKEKVIKDQIKRDYAINLGWTIFIFWENDINTNNHEFILKEIGNAYKIQIGRNN